MARDRRSSDRHRCAKRSATTDRRTQRSAGTAGAPVFTPAPRPAGPRNCTSLWEKKREDGLERRPPAGIAREREISADEAAP